MYIRDRNISSPALVYIKPSKSACYLCTRREPHSICLQEAKRWIIKWPHRLTLHHCTSCSVIIIIVLWWRLIGVFHLENKNWNFKCFIAIFKLGFLKNLFYLPGKVHFSSQFPLSLHLLTTELFTVLYPKPYCELLRAGPICEFPTLWWNRQVYSTFQKHLNKAISIFLKRKPKISAKFVYVQ